MGRDTERGRASSRMGVYDRTRGQAAPVQRAEDDDARIPPDMEFEGYEEEERPKVRRRFEYAWEKVAANARTPDFRTRCSCGIVFGAIDQETLTLMITTHKRLSSFNHTGRAQIELGSNV